MAALSVRYHDGDDTDCEGLHYLSFSHHAKLMSTGTREGFAVFSTDSYKPVIERRLSSGIGLVALLRETNLLAIVGDGSRRQAEEGDEHASCSFSQKSVVLWDEHAKKVVANVECDSAIRAVRLHDTFLFIALDYVCHVYSIDSLELLFSFPTARNPNGIISVSDGERLMGDFKLSHPPVVLALPAPPCKDPPPPEQSIATAALSTASSLIWGSAPAATEQSVPHYANVHFLSSSAETRGPEMHKESSAAGSSDSMSHSVMRALSTAPREVHERSSILVHHAPVFQLTLSPNGLLLATASTNGNRVMVFNSVTGERLRVFRRGAASVQMHALAFCPRSTLLCAVSDSDTVHVWDQYHASGNKGVLDWTIRSAEEQRSIIQIQIPLSARHTQRIASIVGSPPCLHLVCSNGEAFRFELDLERREAHRVGYHIFREKEL